MKVWAQRAGLAPRFGGIVRPRRAAKPRWLVLLALGMIALGFLLPRTETPRARALVDPAVGQPDLSVTGIESAQSADGCPALPAGILVTVRNTGQAPAAGFDTTLSGGATACGPWRLALLAPGEDYTFFCPAGLPGASSYTALADSGDAVAESDEGNNQRVETVAVVTLPTCTPSATPTQTPTAVPTGWLGPLTISGVVSNQSSGLPIAGAAVGGSVTGSGSGALPSVTTQPNGVYQIATGFALYDTDTIHLSASADGFLGRQEDVGALAIHMGATVDLALEPIVPTPTPTPTKPAYLHITVDLQGRPPPPHPAWQTPLEVTLLHGEAAVWSDMIMCDSLGIIRIEELDQTTYGVRIKGANTLTTMLLSPVLAPGPNLMHAGPLRGGDVNGDDRIDIIDFSLFRTLFRSGDPRGDLNNSGLVDLLDFSILRTNFGMRGPTRSEDHP